MNYELPNLAKMSKKEEEEITEKLNTRAKEIAKNFLSGLFFFITVPISIYNKIKNKKSKRECGVWGWTLIIFLSWVIVGGLICLMILRWFK